MIERDGIQIGVFPEGPWLPRAVEDVEYALELVRRIAKDGDDEMAHIAEKALWRGVLVSIGGRLAEDAQAMARSALTSDEIQFSRWYA